MAKRTLTITVSPDWRSALRAAGRAAQAVDYQGERLNFESFEGFFEWLTARRWALLQALLGAGTLAEQELARRTGSDLEPLHEDLAKLAELGLVEQTRDGKVLCPFAAIHLDVLLETPADAA
ncbi:HVO_A0114 family putative DNA-binding protein [Thiocapsa bogorovii]|uniref:HVO_A0114 family putative DNA-binding protein n=1 Tax=Thiocapsa bogorovii TaxID=521689 RepID=UPI001E41A0B2|nr:transcriptional regulator [Thiocapsa bogorovii]UHD17644.1 transcriptional regulator [Thiocapsa bogorovii]